MSKHGRAKVGAHAPAAVAMKTVSLEERNKDPSWPLAVSITELVVSRTSSGNTAITALLQAFRMIVLLRNPHNMTDAQAATEMAELTAEFAAAYRAFEAH